MTPVLSLAKLCNFGRSHHEEHFCEIILNLNQWFRRKSLKDISYLELWQPLCSRSRNHLCNFGRRHHEEQFCEIIFNLDQWFKRRCRLKIFIIWSSGGPFVQWSRTIYAILVKCIMRNNHLWNFESGHHGEHSCEVILNLDQWFRRRFRLKKKFTDNGSTTDKDRSHYLTLSLWLR